MLRGLYGSDRPINRNGITNSMHPYLNVTDTQTNLLIHKLNRDMLCMLSIRTVKSVQKRSVFLDLKGVRESE